jgi:hypothetical protein
VFTKDKGSTKLTTEVGNKQQKLPRNIFVRYMFSRRSEGPYVDLPMGTFVLLRYVLQVTSPLEYDAGCKNKRLGMI